MAPALPSYRGRFAPTASGPLHLGSLCTALAGWLEAHRASGEWRLRIDDLDAPRCRPEHATTILHQLEAHGLVWDGAVRYQSAHRADYEAAFAALRDRGEVYRCGCTRAALARTQREGPDGPVYSGHCRQHPPAAGAAAAWRLRLDAHPESDPYPTAELCLDDRWQGRICRRLQQDIGDFVLRRSDGQIGYQLACVVDDRDEAITDVVRGADLIGSSLRQLLLFRRLGVPAPRYAHLPVLAEADGRKLSKQNHAPPILTTLAADNLRAALQLLGQPAPMAGARPEMILTEALRHWSPAAVPTGPTLVIG